jgi:hypothetical protein
VDRPTSTGGWRERPALALLAWESLLSIRWRSYTVFAGAFLIWRNYKTTRNGARLGDLVITRSERFADVG